ncbi:MAG: hypothetical protein AAF840_01905 [Bacteroidota bacterium]
MQSLQTTGHYLPTPQQTTLPIYKLALACREVEFLNWFLLNLLRIWQWEDMQLEIAVLFDFGRKHREKLSERQDVKIKLKTPEIMALKRVLFLPPLPSEVQAERNSILAKIDPLTPGIF